MNYSSKLISITASNTSFQKVCNALIDLNGQGLAVAGGFIRNMVWDSLFNVKTVYPVNDVDIVFMENEFPNYSEKTWEENLNLKCPQFQWSVKGQQRMAAKHQHQPYQSLNHALSKWVETATAIGYMPLSDDWITPYGLSDLFMGICKPTQPEMTQIMTQRIKEKEWLERYPRLKIIEPN